MDKNFSPVAALAMDTFVPCYSVYTTELAQKPVFEALRTSDGAKQYAHGSKLRRFVIRRSYRAGNREMLRGQIVYTCSDNS